jgi:NADP-dependent 3-hydroxy acid dehydrogenase YdfG
VSDLVLTGKVAVVTGGGKGVGRLLVEQLASAGASVAIVGRHEDTLEQTAAALRAGGATVLPLVADVTEPGTATEVLIRVQQELGPLDILVNNAGVANVGTVEAIDADFWWQAFEINVRAPMQWCQAALPTMIGRGSGRIVNVSSTAATWTIPGGSAYIASKAAVSRFTSVLDAEVRAKGILVFAYAPRLKTEMTDGIQASPVMPEAFRTAAKAVPETELEARRQRSIDLFRRIVSGSLDHHAGEHLETETPPTE